MLLEEMEIFGFKSFSEKTKINFSSGPTSIIGPNGCGKSNILDALKWVLGDRSLRSLRGEKMVDIIFSGSAHKNASNYAQVNITLNNKKRILNIDADKVQICRRYYRDGQSQVFLNQNKATLRELEDILMDTGLGKSCYSFMEQGKIEMILSSKPEDRRYIFEEAAGVSRFKQQQEEALQKLESTELNILRLQDIFHKVEAELKTRSMQATKAQTHKKLKNILMHQEIKIKYLLIQEIDDKMNRLQKKMSQKKGDQEKNHQKKIFLSEKIENNTQERENLFKTLYQKEALIQMDKDKIEQCKSLLNEIKLKTKASESSQNRLKTDISDFERRISSLKSQELKIKQADLELEKEISDKIKLRQNFNQRIMEQEEEIKNFEEKIKNFNISQHQKNKEIKKLRTERGRLAKDILSTLRVEKKKWVQNQQMQEAKKNKFLARVEVLFLYLNNLEKKNQLKLNQFLQKHSYESWSKIIHELSDLDHSIKNFFFSDQGIFSLKEGLDDQMISLEKDLEFIFQETQKLEKILKEKRIFFFQSSRELQNLMEKIKISKIKKENLHKDNGVVKEQIQREKTQIISSKNLYQNIEKSMVQLVQEEKKNDKKMNLLTAKISSDQLNITVIQKKLKSVDELQEQTLARLKELQKKDQEINSELGDIEIKKGTITGNKESIILDIYHNYEMSLDELNKKFYQKRIDKEKVKLEKAQIQKEIQELGTINYLAIEEVEYLTKERDSLHEQLQDIIKAKDKNLALIQNIIGESEKKFLLTFELIKKNFQKIFETLFGGGETILFLMNPNKPLQSGVDIHVQMPGKNKKSIRLLSGGEKALTAIALMFAIYMVRSSPVCVLDEIDASLDDQNVHRLMELLKKFSDKTQFILITHSKITMSQSLFLFGVTMEEPGVSKLLKVDLDSSVQNIYK